MTWTYDPTAVSYPTSRDKVRLAIGDTDTNDQQLMNEEIDGVLATDTDVNSASVQCCVSLAAKYARRVSIAIGPLRMSLQDRADFYLKLANQLQGSAASSVGGIGVPFVGGISIADMESAETDTDRPPSRNTVGMGEAPGVLPPTAPPTVPYGFWWGI